MDLFEKFMLTKEISLSEGKIELLKRPIGLFPVRFVGLYTLWISNSQKDVLELYYSTKDTVEKGFGLIIGKTYGFSFKDFSKWFVDMATLGGWGRVHFEEIDQEKHRGVIVSADSPIGSFLKGKVEKPCDHFLRGMMAGGASAAFREDVDFIEIDCMAQGKDRCRFVIGTRAELTARFPDFVKEQLGEK